MDELVAGSMRSMQAGMAPLKQQAPASADSEHGSINGSVKSDLDKAAEAVRQEVRDQRARRASTCSHSTDNTDTGSSVNAFHAALAAIPCCSPLQVSKVGLMWGGELKPTAAEAAPMLRDMSARVLRLFALYNGIRLAAGAGSTLAQDLSQRAAAVMTAVKVTTHGTTIEV